MYGWIFHQREVLLNEKYEFSIKNSKAWLLQLGLSMNSMLNLKYEQENISAKNYRS